MARIRKGKCRKKNCPVCRPETTPKLALRTVAQRRQVASYVRRHWNFYIDDMFISRSGWVSRGPESLGHVKKVLTTVPW